MPNAQDKVDSFLREQELVYDKITSQTDVIIKIVDILIKARDDENKIFTIGNGGSASTASHFVSDLLKTSITKGDKRFKAISLVDNVPVTLAWANDLSYEDIFVEQVKNFFDKDDIIIGFSGSGKSKNVIKAMKYVKEKGGRCIGFTGMSGGEFPKICDISFVVPSNDMLVIESVHVALCHCIVSAIRNLGKPQFTYE